MNRVIGLALLVSLMANIVLLYRIFDLGVTTTYGAEEIRHRAQEAVDLQKLLPLLMSTTSREQVLDAARQAGLEVLEKREEGTYVGSVLFSYSDNKVAAITLH